MKKIDKNKRNKYITLYILIFIFIIFKMIIQCFDYSILIGDDLNFAYTAAAHKENIDITEINSLSLCLSQFADLFNRYYCGLLAHILVKTIHLLFPYLINIHPADIVSTPMSIFKGTIFFYLIYLISKFSQIYLKEKKLSISIMFVLSFFIYFIADKNGDDIFIVNTNFYSYTLGIFFYCTFMHSIIKNIVRNKKTSIKELIFLILNAIILANCATVVSFITLISLLLIITYNIFIFLLQKKIFIKKETYEKIKFNLNKNFFIPCITLISTLFCMWNFTNIYKDGLQERTINKLGINFNQIIDYLDVLYKEYNFLFIYFGILIIILSILSKRKLLNIRLINFSLILQCSIITMLLVLFFSGKEGNCDEYWIHLATIKNTITLMSLIPVMLLLNNLFLLIRNWKIRKILKWSLFITSLAFFMFIFIQEVINLKETNYKLKHYNYQHRVRYIEEKMLRFYFLRGEDAILPREELSAHMTYEPCYENKLCIEKHFMITRYYPIIYRDTSVSDKKLCFHEDAYEQFYKNGGRIYQYELENIKFSRLFDENFVLNKDSETNKIKKLYNKF